MRSGNRTLNLCAFSRVPSAICAYAGLYTCQPPHCPEPCMARYGRCGMALPSLSEGFSIDGCNISPQRGSLGTTHHVDATSYSQLPPRRSLGTTHRVDATPYSPHPPHRPAGPNQVTCVCSQLGFVAVIQFRLPSLIRHNPLPPLCRWRRAPLPDKANPHPCMQVHAVSLVCGVRFDVVLAGRLAFFKLVARLELPCVCLCDVARVHRRPTVALYTACSVVA